MEAFKIVSGVIREEAAGVSIPTKEMLSGAAVKQV
jgi:hypothetical protein